MTQLPFSSSWHIHPSLIFAWQLHQMCVCLAARNTLLCTFSFLFSDSKFIYVLTWCEITAIYTALPDWGYIYNYTIKGHEVILKNRGFLFERQERITNKFHQLLCSYPSFIFNFLFLHLHASQQRSFPQLKHNSTIWLKFLIKVRIF